MKSSLHAQQQRGIQRRPNASKGSTHYEGGANASPQRTPQRSFNRQIERRGVQRTNLFKSKRAVKGSANLASGGACVATLEEQDSFSEAESVVEEFDDEVKSDSDYENSDTVYLLTEQMAFDESTCLNMVATKAFRMPVCTICHNDQKHFMFMCPTYKKLDLKARSELVRKLMRCWNCLGPKHTIKECKSKISCKLCKKAHHTSLCSRGPTGPLPEYKPTLSKDKGKDKGGKFKGRSKLVTGRSAFADFEARAEEKTASEEEEISEEED